MPSNIEMTPGNRSPTRYSKTTLSLAVSGLIAAGASFPVLYNQFVVQEKEGNRLAAYKDGEGIWTICGGLTRIDGIRVKETDKLSKEQCNFYNKEHASEVDREMRKRLPRWDDLSTPAQVGIGSFCWTNIGWEKCKSSRFMHSYLANDPPVKYCSYITLWIKDRGRDCRLSGSNCQGQPIRRMQEDELCLIPKMSEG